MHHRMIAACACQPAKHQKPPGMWHKCGHSFVAHSRAGGKAYAVWKCLLEQDHTKPLLDGPGPEQLLHELRKLRAGPGLFVVVLFRGGHFAAGVFQARREEDVGKGAGQKGGHAPPDAFTTLASKTFHRYVVRACCAPPAPPQHLNGTPCEASTITALGPDTCPYTLHPKRA